MTYLLHDNALEHTNLYFDFIDGDIRKVENEDRSVDIGINPPRSTKALRFGRRVRTEFLPTRICPTTIQTNMPDFSSAQLGQVCSAKFRDAVESVEPNVHQFVPVQVVSRNDDWIADMFWFVPCNRLDTLAVELLHPPVDNLGFYSWGGSNSRMAFSRSKIGQHHIWVDMRIIGGFIYVSDTFREAAIKARLIGLNLVQKETV